MDLERRYYEFAVQDAIRVEVTLASGHPIEFGSTALPFTADGRLEVGESHAFDEDFIINVPGRSSFDLLPDFAASEPAADETQPAEEEPAA